MDDWRGGPAGHLDVIEGYLARLGLEPDQRLSDDAFAVPTVMESGRCQ